MSRHDPALLDQITGTAEKWLRRCNGHPKEGSLETAAGLRAVLASSQDVKVGDNDVITWRAAAGLFSAEPVRDELPG